MCSTAKKRRICVYVDGFNLYRGLAKPLDCKWVNLQRLFEKLYENDEVVRVYFFSSWISGPNRYNQQTYVDAL